MQQLYGPISDKLRSLFSDTDKVWTPKRPPDSTPMPKTGVQGVKLSPGRRRSR